MNEARQGGNRIDPRDLAGLRGALGRFATGVTVIAARAPDGAPIGFTANSFNSVSLDPPLILWSLARSSERLPAYRAAKAYAVNVLGAGQAELARRFASRVEDRYAGVGWRPGLGGAPVLDGAIAVFECVHEAIHPAGDHELFIGRVERCTERGGAPLTFFGGDFGTVMGAADPTPDPLRRAAARAADLLGRARARAMAAAGLDEAAWTRLELLAEGPRPRAPEDEALIARGLARPGADASVAPSPAGEAALEAAARDEAEWERRCARALAPEEAAALAALLARIRDPEAAG
ncbi:flavin reductase family protein [Oceanicella actignis]|uniref:NADH-FMN oxidoreductase RutF, flavin reductase (DIM6/NTAB) family n=1 Tax=Oceanicella actignis TaxID=1189325 RepID=A0A1M7TEU6_9RHOB|nr:flavin reductase family protein [Oceanicella actignis]SET61990.1 NADH-FMN oxidoreductase RutF, flavin reductase (DIM6/NTAB) family [Oceanicella actignis]SHN69207.1 NADH-FMN oxidoreductase RutF, flavin reductase (DIM6/NTAB) family [Oceanicella actignis]